MPIIIIWFGDTLTVAPSSSSSPFIFKTLICSMLSKGLTFASWMKSFLPSYCPFRMQTSNSMSSFTSHTLCKVFLPLPLLFTLLPPHFYRLTLNHLPSYTPDSRTISICHASPHSHTLNAQKIVQFLTFYPSTTLYTSISPSFTILLENDEYSS